MMTDFSSGEGTSTSGEKRRGDEVKSCGNYADSLVLVTLSVREREKTASEVFRYLAQC